MTSTITELSDTGLPSDGGARRDLFVCEPSDSLHLAIERCLDNGVGTCFVVDHDDRLLGSISLEDARQALREGAHLGDTALSRMRPGAQTAWPRNAEPAQPLLDASGRLVDITVDHSRGFVNVARPDLGHREFRSLLDAFLSTWISSQGEHVGRFEREFATFLGRRHGVAVCNGTAALHLGLVALGIGQGDEVIVPDLTFAATINAVLHAGARPVIVDVDPRTWGIDPAAAERAINRRTKAMIPVHLYGRPADMGALTRLASARGLAIVEDCAEAHGARYGGRPVGSFGNVACFSFFANKVITTGEGGMCLTDTPALAETMQVLRDHGSRAGVAYWHDLAGYNYRLTSLQASIGLAQLSRIEQALARNRHLEQLYRAELDGTPGLAFPPPLPAPFEPIVWLVGVLVPPRRRAALIAAAREAGLELRPFFTSLSSMPLYRRYAGHCPVSEGLARAGLILPTSSAVDINVVRKVAAVLRGALAG